MFPVNPLGSFKLSTSNGSTSGNVTCVEPEYYLWVYNVFHECVYNPKEEVGFVLGLVSILCWIIATLPQLYENYKNGNVDESLSIWFILFWLFGDSCNLVGCVLTQQFPVQLYTAVYYVSMDIVMLIQFTYYKIRHQRQTSGRGVISEALTSPFSRRGDRVLCCVCLGVLFPFVLSNLPHQRTLNSYQAQPRIGRTLLQVHLPTPSHHIEWTLERTIGYVIGCFSSVFYLGSRLPQIIKNYNRGQTEGVSAAMFLLAICGNMFYGASILLQDPDQGSTWSQFILYHLPWLIGSLGTMSLDLFILSQICYYSNRCRRCRNLPSVLLVDDENNLNDSFSNDPLVV